MKLAHVWGENCVERDAMQQELAARRIPHDALRKILVVHVGTEGQPFGGILALPVFLWRAGEMWSAAIPALNRTVGAREFEALYADVLAIGYEGVLPSVWKGFAAKVAMVEETTGAGLLDSGRWGD